jgi:hypothetical protein
MRGALGEHADAAVAALKLPREKLRDVLLAMTTPEGKRAHVALETLVERFGPEAKEAVFALTKARLVASETPGFTFVHDSILRDWPLVRGWIEEARDDRLLVAHVERDAARWSESKDPAELWRKGRLAAALDLWKRGVPLGDEARRFLAASAREERKAWFVFWSLVSTVVLLVVGGSIYYAKLSADHAAQARRDAAALAAALAEVKTLKRQTEEQAMEAATTAALLADLQKKMAEEHKAYGASVQAAIKKVASATSLDGAQKATEELKAPAPPHNPVVPVPTDLAGLAPSGPGPSSAGTFDQSAIERVVSSRKNGVKRTCLDRSASAGGSTKVTATLTIAPSGQVQDVTTAGNDPVIAKCIEQQLRTWTFPAPGEPKQVQIPFVFVRQ